MRAYFLVVLERGIFRTGSIISSTIYQDSMKELTGKSFISANLSACVEVACCRPVTFV